MARAPVNRSMAAASIALFALTASNVVRQAASHPNCIDDSSPSKSADAQFCPDELEEGFCCNSTEESEIQLKFDTSLTTGTCADLYKEVLCGKCHPYAGHLYERLVEDLTMTNEFCTEFYDECSEQLNLNENFCAYHTGGDDQFWSYPVDLDDTFTGDGLNKAFSKVSDSILPEEPIDMRMTPDGTKWWILGLEGTIMEVDAVEEATSIKLIMDISDDILYTYEEGLLSFAFSPGFHTTGVFYATYVFGPTVVVGDDEYGANRLSRFVYDPSSPANTLASEEILLETSDKSSNVHSAGWIGFKPSSYASDDAGTSHELFWSIGDAGPQYDLTNNGQNPDTLHGSIVRILVSSESGSGYSIPSSNPFAGGGGMGEICAQGFRNPFRCSFDRLNDDLYCGDVGHLEIESIKKVECGNNYGWRRFEGPKCMDDEEIDLPETCEEVNRNAYTFPEYSYCHSDYDPDGLPDYILPDTGLCGDKTIVGSAVIGGFMYRGTKYGDLLGGNYVFADFQWKHINHLYPEDGGDWGEGVVYTNAKITSFAEDNSGELYFLTYKGSVYHLPCGDICDGDDVNPVTPEPVPISSMFPTPAPIDVEVPLPTPAPIVPETPMPTVVVDIVDETPAPVAAETPAPVASETPAPVASGTPAPVASETPAPVASETPAPVASETPAPVVPETPAPITETPPAPSPSTTPKLANVPELIPEDAGPPLHPVSPDDLDVCDMDLGDVVMSGPEYEEVSPPEYLGCYVDDSSSGLARLMHLAFLTDFDMTPTMCEDYCRVSGADMFGVEYGHQCFCGDSRDVDLNRYGEADCDMPCSGDSSAICGGSHALSAYLMGGGPTAPEGSVYLGCRSDSRDDRLLKDGFVWCDDTMTVQVCEYFCRAKGATVYGLQYSHECWCGDVVDPDEHGPAVCNYRCSGDSGATCGGYDALSVYSLLY